MPPVTYLFVPGDRPERFEKARLSGADMVVLDLEDSVRAERKPAARAHVAEALVRGDVGACVRVNGSDSEWFEEDCRLLSLPGVMAVMLPKAEDADVLAAMSAALNVKRSLIPLVETARGLAAATTLASGAHVLRLAFGTVDLQLDLGIEGDDSELLFARSQLVLASRLAQVAPPVDGVTMEVRDVEQLRKDAVRARRMGFGAKLCIHPAQVLPVREAFTPDAQTIAWAQGVLDAASSISSGALIFEGRMVDRPVLDRARAILARATHAEGDAK